VKRWMLCGILVIAACGKETPVAPTPPPAPAPAPVIAACQSNNTATVSFENTSRSTTHTVKWDGFVVATLAPGETSESRTVAAGVSHTYAAYIANTSALACAVGQPVPATCSSTRYGCAFP
jgi:hypothetical protein